MCEISGLLSPGFLPTTSIVSDARAVADAGAFCIVVEGVNIVKKHRKARTAEEQGGIIEMAAPIHASNVMLLDPKTGAPTRTKRRVDTDGTKERLSVKSGEPIPRAR